MIKGILALFRSGLIFNPMVLSGILLAFIAIASLDDAMLKALYTNSGLYILALICAGIYVYFFKPIYFTGGYKINWKETILSTIGHFLMFIISFVCAMLFVSVISFGGKEEEEEKKQYPEIEKLTNEIKQQEQVLQENYNAILKAYETPQL